MVKTFGNFGKQNLLKSCLEGPHPDLIRKQFFVINIDVVVVVLVVLIACAMIL